eukprot:TRINITY_DN32851_c0_g1_i1.p1 TRINITY_DN32851_c0_g1~~TRINITY_DN32851_c0_g1_i1.p1  ORF type:complete len:630 (-),score=139.18 TRINITY_DN32851_c0_g1_i1:12-1859(-)
MPGFEERAELSAEQLESVSRWLEKRLQTEAVAMARNLVQDCAQRHRLIMSDLKSSFAGFPQISPKSSQGVPGEGPRPPKNESEVDIPGQPLRNIASGKESEDSPRVATKDTDENDGANTPSSSKQRIQAKRSSTIDFQSNKINKTDLIRLGTSRLIEKKYENSWLRRVENFVLSPISELIFSVLILANALIMAAEIQYQGIVMASKFDMKGYWDLPWAATFFEVSEIFFGVGFSLEAVLKITILRQGYLLVQKQSLEVQKEPTSTAIWLDRVVSTVERHLSKIEWWNVFDFMLVVFWLLSALSIAHLPIDPLILRMCRLARLLRLLRLARTIKGFDSLHLITTTITGSISALFWSAVLLLLMMMLIAAVMNEWLVVYMNSEDEDADPVKQEEVYKYFGTFSRAMLSMFELTVGNWAPITRMLVDNVSEWFTIFAIVQNVFIGFAVLSVIRGVFLHETFQVAATDDQIMMAHKTRARKTHQKKMKRLFAIADADGDGDGFLDIDEFRLVCKDDIMQTWLMSMDMNIKDADRVFELIAGGRDSKIDCPTLTKQMSVLKGAATSIDMHILKDEMKVIDSTVKELRSKVAANQTNQADMRQMIYRTLQKALADLHGCDV